MARSCMRWMQRFGVALLALFLVQLAACRSASVRSHAAAHAAAPARDRGDAPGGPRPAVIGATEGERRLLRAGAAPLYIKVDPITTGSQRMVLGVEDIGPGDAIRVHRHLQEDELVFIHRGTATVELGAATYTAAIGATVFIPQGTCVALANAGTDTLTIVFVFSSPGFEQVLRDLSSREGEPPRVVSPAQRAAAFEHGHAVAAPSNC